MGMSIDEIILTEKEIAENFQRTVDTHMVSGDMSLEELYCDDTEIIEEELKRCQGLADFHNQIVDTMRNYQKIEDIYYHQSGKSLENSLRAVIEDEYDN